jgi:hypothetical protein
MARFLAIHPVGSDLTLESGTPIAQSIKAHHTTDAYWLRRYYAPESGTLHCIWDATDAEAIRPVLTEAARELHTEGPCKIEMYIHSEDFR